MQLNYAQYFISEDEYLQGELVADSKHEYLDGEVYAIAGASENHNLLAGNIFAELKTKLKGSPCRTFMADMKVKAEHAFFYPDVMVVCERDDASEYYKQAPVIIVEVLSKATRKFDQTLKRQRYQALPSLEEYVLIAQDMRRIECYRRDDSWDLALYQQQGCVHFKAIDLELPIEDIYDGIALTDSISRRVSGA